MLYAFDHQELHQKTPRLAPGDPSDEQLMRSIQKRDEGALRTIYQRHAALLRTVISRMVNNDHDVEDILQECFLDIWRHADNYSQAKGQALGWLVTLARRRAIDRVRRKAAYGRAQDRFRDEVKIETDALAAGADEEAATTDSAKAVASLIKNLPEAQQRAVHLAFYRGMTQREIAAYTGTPLGTIKTRLELALRKLRSAVLAFGELHDSGLGARTA